MYLHRLDLIAFGPFTDTALEFAAPSAGPGLHVVFGPNEAGKSSTLRALRAALFGFPVQTSDNFLHEYSRLRVGATLERGGKRLSFLRRKGAKNTLLAADSQRPLPEDALRPFLGPLREEEFFSLFAIGHGELRAGGQAVLRGEGKLSDLLFMSAAGLPRLRQIERSFADEAESLFKPQGSKPPINDALLRLVNLKKTLEEKSLRAEEFLRHTRALQQAKAERTTVEEELITVRATKSRLDRLSQALPGVARYRQYKSQLVEFRDAPRLPMDFTRQREQCEQEARGLAGRLEQLQVDLAATEQQLSGLTVPEEVLSAGPEIERLFKRLGSHEKAVADTRDRLVEIAQHEVAARELLRSIYPNRDLDDVESLRLTRQEQTALRKTAARREELVSALRSHESTTARLTEHIAATTAELERLGPEVPLDALREAVQRAAREGDLEAALSTAEANVAELRQRLRAGASSLPLWSGEIEAVSGLPIPPVTTIDRFEREFLSLDQELVRLSDRRADVQATLAKAERALDLARRGGDVPSLEALEEARQHRDLVWQEIRRELKGVEPGPLRSAILGDMQSLSDAFEAAVRRADELADRLRTEAERVEKVARHQEDVAARRRELEQIEREESRLHDRRQTLVEEWQRLWTFLDNAPLMPREMREWLARHKELVALVGQHLTAVAHVESLRQRAATRVGELAVALARFLELQHDREVESRFDRLFDLADRTLREREKTAERRRFLANERQRLDAELRDAKRGAEAARRELDIVQSDWIGWMRRLGLPETSSGDAALAVLDTLTDLFAKLTAIQSLEERVAGMRANAEEFTADAREAAVRLAPDLAEHPPEEAVAILNDRLAHARALQAQHHQLSERRDSLQRAIAKAGLRRGEIDTELQALCRQAGCTDPHDLPLIEARVEERRRLESLKEQAENELRRWSGGRTIEELIAELDAANPDTLELEREAITKHAEELQDRRVELERIIAQHEQKLSQMTGGAEAITAAEDAQAVIARLSADIEHYARLRFAIRLLRSGRERFREKRGNAVLDRASDLFTRLTARSFVGLKVDYGDNDEPLLVGVRSDQTSVRPQGMSDGTCDQLYLALRLAGLSVWLDEHDPLPFIVDDILVHFDDARSTAALQVLGSLAMQTQVIVFTHHAHLVELARGALPADVLCVHEIGTADAANASNGEPISEPVSASGRIPVKTLF